MDLLDDDPQLREALAAAVTGGPEAPSVEGLLLDARTARRAQAVRRAVGGLAVAAAVAAAALAGVQVLTPDSGSRRSDGVVADESKDSLDLRVHVSARGTLVAEPGTTIERTIEDPLDRRPDGRSWGIVVTTHGGDELWGLVDWSSSGTFSSVEPARARFAAVEDWIDHVVAASTGTPEPHPVAFAQDGTLVSTGAVRLVRQRTGMLLGPDDLMTAVAEVVVTGRRRFVIARITAGGSSYVVLTPDQVPGGFQELVARAPELLAEVER